MLAFAIGSLMVPGCVIQIGPGTTSSDPEGPRGATTGAGAGPSSTSDEQAAIDALENVDPTEAALKAAAASYSAAACSSLVETQVQDPTVVDEATIQQLFDQVAPIANDAALAWMETADPASLSSIGVFPKFECMDPPNNCARQERCPIGDGATCVVTGCGKGKCPWCDLFGGLNYDGYCAYACMQGSKYWGYGFNLRTRFGKGWNGFVCFPFGK